MANDSNNNISNGRKPTEITKEGLQELKAELKELTETKLPAVIKRVAEAREYGDLSENAEYHDAKDEQRFVETRIEDIEEILANAKVVQNTRSTTTVGMGSKVEIKKKGNKKSKVIHIVGEFEADPMADKISNVSPLGRALIGKKAGDEALVKAPAGAVNYEVVEIK